MAGDNDKDKEEELSHISLTVSSVYTLQFVNLIWCKYISLRSNKNNILQRQISPDLHLQPRSVDELFQNLENVIFNRNVDKCDLQMISNLLKSPDFSDFSRILVEVLDHFLHSLLVRLPWPRK